MQRRQLPLQPCYAKRGLRLARGKMMGKQLGERKAEPRPLRASSMHASGKPCRAIADWDASSESSFPPLPGCVSPSKSFPVLPVLQPPLPAPSCPGPCPFVPLPPRWCTGLAEGTDPWSKVKDGIWHPLLHLYIPTNPTGRNSPSWLSSLSQSQHQICCWGFARPNTPAWPGHIQGRLIKPAGLTRKG